jgi:hypothetical protein
MVFKRNVLWFAESRVNAPRLMWWRRKDLREMLKKIGLSAVALFGILLIAPAQQAKAGVHFGIGVGAAPAVPYYGYAAPAPDPYYAPQYDPYAYDYTTPYAAPYVAPTYAYPYSYGGYYGGGGWGGHHRDWDDHRGWGGGHREGRGGGGHEFRGGHGGGWGHRR